jgi:hypothetical protein
MKDKKGKKRGISKGEIRIGGYFVLRTDAVVSWYWILGFGKRIEKIPTSFW